MTGLSNEETLALIEELTDELDASINAEYGMQHGQKALHPVQQRRYLRDMETVRKARAYLAEHKPKD